MKTARMAIVGLTLLAAGVVKSGAQVAGDNCLSYEPATVQLTGKLQLSVLPGTPNYTSYAGGDRAEPVWLLTLSAPICVAAGADQGDVAQSGVTVVQLSPVAFPGLREVMGLTVSVTGTLSYGPHHAKLLMNVQKVALAQAPLPAPSH